jgi:hypothetical protein
VIPKQELLHLRAEWQLDVGVIEKDYVLGWLLAAITAEPELSRTWILDRPRAAHPEHQG